MGTVPDHPYPARIFRQPIYMCIYIYIHIYIYNFFRHASRTEVCTQGCVCILTGPNCTYAAAWPKLHIRPLSPCPLTMCDWCGSTDGRRQYCQCRAVQYCGGACQLQHWRAHRTQCDARAVERALLQSFPWGLPRLIVSYMDFRLHRLLQLLEQRVPPPVARRIVELMGRRRQ